MAVPLGTHAAFAFSYPAHPWARVGRRGSSSAPPSSRSRVQPPGRLCRCLLEIDPKSGHFPVSPWVPPPHPRPWSKALSPVPCVLVTVPTGSACFSFAPHQHIVLMTAPPLTRRERQVSPPARDARARARPGCSVATGPALPCGCPRLPGPLTGGGQRHPARPLLHRCPAQATPGRGGSSAVAQRAAHAFL